jgi:hypothetical protein
MVSSEGSRHHFSYSSKTTGGAAGDGTKGLLLLLERVPLVGRAGNFGGGVSTIEELWAAFEA